MYKSSIGCFAENNPSNLRISHIELESPLLGGKHDTPLVNGKPRLFIVQAGFRFVCINSPHR